MKKLFTLSVFIAAFVLNLAACSVSSVKVRPSQSTPSPLQAVSVLTGKIVHISDGACLIAGSGSTDLFSVSTNLEIKQADNKQTDASALKTGQTVEVGYSGQIMESYPAQPYKPAYIKITGQSDDLVGFYKNVLNDLWKVDPGLNPDSGVLAFDLTQATNLTDSEKSALVYLVSNAYGLQGITGTFDELAQKGLIDKEKLFFEKGILFTIKIKDVAEGGFTFDASKWRSGLGAYFFIDCKAIKNGYSWSYTVGSQAIS